MPGWPCNSLSKSIEHARKRLPCVDARLFDGRVQQLVHGPEESRAGLAQLTPRQRAILRCIAEGQTTQEIARTLQISAKTVEGHRALLMERLDIHDVAGLVRFALRAGLADDRLLPGHCAAPGYLGGSRVGGVGGDPRLPAPDCSHHMVLSDITARVQAETALRELNATLAERVDAQTAALHEREEHLCATKDERPKTNRSGLGPWSLVFGPNWQKTSEWHN
jgi:DNA-binding CsgD family transcriptional regulator